MTDEELEHELAEAKSEIARHHRDFERIRAWLDWADVNPRVFWKAAFHKIRNIVG